MLIDPTSFSLLRLLLTHSSLYWLFAQTPVPCSRLRDFALVPGPCFLLQFPALSPTSKLKLPALISGSLLFCSGSRSLLPAPSPISLVYVYARPSSFGSDPCFGSLIHAPAACFLPRHSACSSSSCLDTDNLLWLLAPYSGSLKRLHVLASCSGISFGYGFSSLLWFPAPYSSSLLEFCSCSLFQLLATAPCSLFRQTDLATFFGFCSMLSATDLSSGSLL